MINVYNSTPKVYYNNSRDFQLLGRTTEIILNYLLTNTNECNALYPEGTFLDLLLYTLGFNKEVGYSSIDLNALSKVFKYVVKHKGTKEAIKIIINLLLRSQNISDIAVVEINNMDDPFRNQSSEHTDDWLYRITVYLPVDSKDFSFIEDMFDYILPAGYIYQVYYTQFSEIVYNDIYGVGISKLSYKGDNDNVLFGSIVGSKQLGETGITYDTDKVLSINQMANSITITSTATSDNTEQQEEE